MYADAENINQLFINKGYYASDHLNVFIYKNNTKNLFDGFI